MKTTQDAEKARSLRHAGGVRGGPFQALFWQQPQPLNIPRKVMDRACSGENNAPARGECQPNQALSSDFQFRFGIGRDPYNPARAAKGGGYIEISIYIEGQSLRTAERFEERRHRATGIDLEDAVVRAGNE